MDSSSGFCLLFFSFTTLFCFFSFLAFLFHRKRLCSCHMFQAFLSSSWARDFHNLCDWYTHLLRLFPSGTVHVHVLRNVITANPSNVQHMLRTKFPNYPKGNPFFALFGDLLGHDIFVADGHYWRFQRKLASLELGSVSICSFESEILSRLVQLLKGAADDGNGLRLDLQDVFRRFSFDTICRFSFDVELGCLEPSLPPSNFVIAFDLISKLSAERALSLSPIAWKLKRFFNLGSENEVKDTIKRINSVIENMIPWRREVGSSGVGVDDLLSRFMSSVTDDRYLRDIFVSFMLVGRDTVASALTSFFWC